MADPVNSQNSQPPWWITALQRIVDFIKKNWSGLAVLGYEYEEGKVDAAKQSEDQAKLEAKLATDEVNIRKADADKSDDDIIAEQLERDKSGSN